MSERQLSKSYGELQKWKSSSGRTQKWVRWKFAKPKEKWLQKNELTEDWLVENLEWMIGGKVASIRKAYESRLYYIVTTEKREKYYLIFENEKTMVLIFENHWQNYSFNVVLRTLDLDIEMYDCYQNNIKYISFYHGKTVDGAYYVNTSIVGGKFDLNFTIKHNLPVWKVISDHGSLFEEITKYNSSNIGAFDEKRQIDKVVKIARMLRKRKSEDITRFEVKFDYNKEWFDVDSKGISMKARLCDGGNYVTCHKDGSMEWLERYCIQDRGYRIKEGVIVDWKDEKVTDQRFTKKIISDIREAESLFEQMKQEFLAD